jgi:hypothetical protein
MSTEDDREKRREESPEWHRARAKSLREHGFTKMAEEHEQIATAAANEIARRAWVTMRESSGRIDNLPPAWAYCSALRRASP